VNIIKAIACTYLFSFRVVIFFWGGHLCEVIVFNGRRCALNESHAEFLWWTFLDLASGMNSSDKWQTSLRVSAREVATTCHCELNVDVF